MLYSVKGLIAEMSVNTRKNSGSRGTYTHTCSSVFYDTHPDALDHFTLDDLGNYGL